MRTNPLEIPVLYGAWCKGKYEALIVFNPYTQRVSVKGFKIVDGKQIPGPVVSNFTHIPRHLALEVFKKLEVLEKTKTQEVLSDELVEWCKKIYLKASERNSWFNYEVEN